MKLFNLGWHISGFIVVGTLVLAGLMSWAMNWNNMRVTTDQIRTSSKRDEDFGA